VHDVSDGGLLIALAEMAIASGLGARLYAAATMMPAHAFWFGEDQARYVVTVRPEHADAVMARAKAAGVPLRRLGQTSGEALRLPDEPPIPVRTLAERFEAWLPGYMAGSQA
jgi:phosphoribosylformylglycinamidine synthase subunit PurL